MIINNTGLRGIFFFLIITSDYLIFLWNWCIFIFEFRFRSLWILDSQLFTSVLSAKAYMNRPSLISSFAQEICGLPQQRPLCLCVSCWASLFAFLEQVLGRTYICTYGDSSGFFCAQTLPCAYIVSRPRSQCSCLAFHPALSFLPEIS